MRNSILIIFTLTVSIKVFSQISTYEPSISITNNLDFNDIPILKTVKLDMSKIIIEDKHDVKINKPPRFGYPVNVSITLENNGKIDFLPNGDRIWRIRIICPDAKSIGFNFTKFNLEKGVKVWAYRVDKIKIKGAYTSFNNKGTDDKIKGFAISPIYGEDVVLEVYEPKLVIGKSTIELNQIIHGYRFIKSLIPNKSSKNQNFDDAGSCQVNVNCIPEGNAWQDEKRGVAMILIDNQRVCTGSLINNTANNQDLLFLTANHCIEPLDVDVNTDASNWTFWWDYEGEIQATGNSSCINPTTDPSHRETSGAILIANNYESDFALFRLTENPRTASPPINIFFNGWSRTNNPIVGGAGIHHPSGDIKKKSTHNLKPLLMATNGTHPYNTSTSSFFEVLWMQTANGFSVTEGGSSGSPLFMDDGELSSGLIIGQLWGGSSDNCTSPGTDEGVYGKIGVSWNTGITSNRRLKEWLDPLNLNVESLNGGYPDQCESIINMYKTINSNVTYQASNNIISTSEINTPSVVDIRAGNNILLKPGFHSKLGSNTHIHIDNCITNVIPLSKKNSKFKNEDKSKKTFIYPNPTKSISTIEYFNPSKGKVSIEIYSILGVKVYSTTIENENEFFKFNINLIDFEDGTYIVKISSLNELESVKLIIEK